jgi:hypothetical protein
MFSKKTPVKLLYDKEFKILQSLGCDPLISCDGIIWADNQLSISPNITLDDLIRLFQVEKEGDVAAWASGLLCHHWNDLYEEFRLAMISLMDGDNCLRVIKEIKSKLDNNSKLLLREGYKNRHKNSVLFDAELNGA